MNLKKLKEFKIQFIVLISFIVIINILIIYIVNSTFLFANTKKDIENRLLTNIDFVKNEIDNKRKAILEKTIIIEQDEILSKIINKKDNDYEIKLIISKYNNNFPNAYIEIFNQNEVIIGKSFKEFPSNEDNKTAILKRALKSKFLHSEIIEIKGILYIRSIISVLRNGTILGVVMLKEEISSRYLDSLKSKFKEDIKLYNSSLEATASTFFTKDSSRDLYSDIKKRETSVFTNKNSISAFKYYKDNNLGIEIISNLNDFIKKEKKIRLKLIYINITLIIFSYLIFNFIISKLIEPINLLIEGLSEVKKGNFDKKIHYSINNEMGVAINTFNDMLFALKEKKNNEKRIANLDKIATAGRLASSIAHEIKNPLSGISIIIDMYLKEFSNIEFEKKDFEVISIEIKRINEIITRLVDFSKEEKIEIKEENLIQIVDDIFILLKRKAIENKNSIVFNKSTDDIFIKCDKNLIKQVLINLILNSIDASNNGVIEINLEQNKTKTILRIKDNGKGMDEATLKRALEPFYTTKIHGSGIGLAVVHKILNIHDFEYEIISTKHKGTEFKISVNNIKNKNLRFEKMNFESEIFERRDGNGKI